MSHDRHILLVDDNPQAMAPLDFRLRAMGFRTTVSTGGEDALRRVQSDKPALVVLDVTMPEMNGYQVCREIKRHDKTLPVVILTAKSDPADKFWATQSGADAFFNKPADPAVL